MIHTTIFFCLQYQLDWSVLLVFFSHKLIRTLSLSIYLVWCVFSYQVCLCCSTHASRIVVDIDKKNYSIMRNTYTILLHKFNSTKSFICCCFLLSSPLSRSLLIPFHFFYVSGCILAASMN